MESVLALTTATVSTFALAFLIGALTLAFAAVSLLLQQLLGSLGNVAFELCFSFVDQ